MVKQTPNVPTSVGPFDRFRYYSYNKHENILFIHHNQFFLKHCLTNGSVRDLESLNNQSPIIFIAELSVAQLDTGIVYTIKPLQCPLPSSRGSYGQIRHYSARAPRLL